MAALVFFVEQIATGLYILSGLGLLLLLRSYFRARASYRATHFELEREIARDRANGALTGVILLAELTLVVVGMQFVVAPHLRETLDVPRLVVGIRDDGIFLTPTPAPLTGGLQIDISGVQLGEVDPVDQILPTPTMTPTPVGTIVPNSPAPIGCDTPNASLQIPANGMIVFEPITLRGIATIEDFAFYRFELNGPSTFGNFAPVGGDGTQPVPEIGELGQFVPSFYQPGEYRLRLMVFDITNTARASCTVTIFISDPIPTPTPLGAPPA
jgi:hypothetical protein